jgi:hypothetical protein
VSRNCSSHHEKERKIRREQSFASILYVIDHSNIERNSFRTHHERSKEEQEPPLGRSPPIVLVKDVSQVFVRSYIQPDLVTSHGPVPGLWKTRVLVEDDFDSSEDADETGDEKLRWEKQSLVRWEMRGYGTGGDFQETSMHEGSVVIHEGGERSAAMEEEGDENGEMGHIVVEGKEQQLRENDTKNRAPDHILVEKSMDTIDEEQLLPLNMPSVG